MSTTQATTGAAAGGSSASDIQSQMDASFARQQAFELMMEKQKQRQEEAKMMTDANMSASAAIGDAAQRL